MKPLAGTSAEYSTPPRYDPLVPARLTVKPTPALPLDLSLLKPGMRLAVAVSGGADSVALLRALAEQNHEKGRELGLVLHVAHLHHGLRGAEADADLEFVRDLAAQLGLPFHEARVDTASEARPDPASGKPSETIEEAARRLRYAWFRNLLSKDLPQAVGLDAVATAHTLDDQAETVLAKFLRGAWTEGLAGIAPKLEAPEGLILRPLLSATRAEVEAYLHALGQSWREDSSNRHLSFTRNRIRHELLPLLETWNPQLRGHLVQMVELARDEEAWWQAELARLAPQLILAGRPVRGGGRAAAGESLALDCGRFAVLAPALQRRLLRHAARQLGAEPDFAATESLRTLALAGRAGQKLELAQGLRAERTPRELRLAVSPAASGSGAAEPVPEYTVVIPGEVAAPAFGLCIRIECAATFPGRAAGTQAILRNWRPGDRVRLRYSSGLRKVKEVLERLRVTGSGRSLWPVLELEGRILWMQGVEVEPEPGILVTASRLSEEDKEPPALRPEGNRHAPKELYPREPA